MKRTALAQINPVPDCRCKSCELIALLVSLIFDVYAESTTAGGSLRRPVCSTARKYLVSTPEPRNVSIKLGNWLASDGGNRF